VCAAARAARVRLPAADDLNLLEDAGDTALGGCIMPASGRRHDAAGIGYSAGFVAAGRNSWGGMLWVRSILELGFDHRQRAGADALGPLDKPPR